MLVIISLFLIGFISAGITSKAIVNNSNDEEIRNSIEDQDEELLQNDDDENEIEIEEETEVEDEIEIERENKFRERVREAIKERNKLKIRNQTGECPDNCSCSGSTTKCYLNNGSREMTIHAGNSGNIIFQVKGINATTNVTLYRAEDGKLYAVNKNNETTEVKMLPNQVKEKIRERLSRELIEEQIELNDDGTYEYQAENRARLFFIFSVKEKIRARVNSETGEVERIQKPWWAFLASDEGEQIIGASCGTVTPGYNDECCKNKDYDFWNAEAGECGFLS